MWYLILYIQQLNKNMYQFYKICSDFLHTSSRSYESESHYINIQGFRVQSRIGKKQGLTPFLFPFQFLYKINNYSNCFIKVISLISFFSYAHWNFLVAQQAFSFLCILKLVSKKFRKNNQHRRNVNHPLSILSATKCWYFRRSSDSEASLGFNPSDKVRGVFLLQPELHLNISTKAVIMQKSFHSCKSRYKVAVIALTVDTIL